MKEPAMHLLDEVRRGIFQRSTAYDRAAVTVESLADTC